MGIFAGVDIGSSYTKAVLINQAKKVLSSCVLNTGADFERVSKRAVSKVISQAKVSAVSSIPIFSTGVGRNLCPKANPMTEISCLARGSFHYLGRAHVVVDIGGQDNKVVAVGAAGSQVSFKMNRKCAAGTGAFLEEIARRLDIPLKKMESMARHSPDKVDIGSYCTVFTCTEIVHHIREGKKAPAILRGCYESVVKRILEMDPLEGEIVLAGGVIANHPIVTEIFQEKLGRSPFVPDGPQLLGALGAALMSLENSYVRT